MPKLDQIIDILTKANVLTRERDHVPNQSPEAQEHTDIEYILLPECSTNDDETNYDPPNITFAPAFQAQQKASQRKPPPVYHTTAPADTTSPQLHQATAPRPTPAYPPAKAAPTHAEHHNTAPRNTPITAPVTAPNVNPTTLPTAPPHHQHKVIVKFWSCCGSFEFRANLH